MVSPIEELGIPPQDVPDDFLDPITQQYMTSPVTCNSPLLCLSPAKCSTPGPYGTMQCLRITSPRGTFLQVILPSSGATLDRSTVMRHLASNPTDPYTQTPLTAQVRMTSVWRVDFSRCDPGPSHFPDAQARLGARRADECLARQQARRFSRTQAALGSHPAAVKAAIWANDALTWRATFFCS